jgi:hypothetical protein
MYKSDFDYFLEEFDDKFKKEWHGVFLDNYQVLWGLKNV